MRQIMIAAGLAILILVATAETLSRGEVVTITTVAANGTMHDTPLWIVEIDGELYLRSGSRNAQWLARLDNESIVWIEIKGVRQRFNAVPRADDAHARERVNRAMAKKYGVADRLLGLFVDAGDSVPIALRQSGP